MKLLVERPQAGQARITCKDSAGNVLDVVMELDAARADAMTNALEAEGKLGVEIDMGAHIST